MLRGGLSLVWLPGLPIGFKVFGQIKLTSAVEEGRDTGQRRQPYSLSGLFEPADGAIESEKIRVARSRQRLFYPWCGLNGQICIETKPRSFQLDLCKLETNNEMWRGVIPIAL